MSISKYFQHVLTFTVCCTAAVIISVAANMLFGCRKYAFIYQNSRGRQ